MEKGNAAERYTTLSRGRESYLTRGYAAAELTIPALFPREGHTAETVLPTPYQSVGARGVSNIAAKLLLALYPPNTPFFKLLIDDAALAELGVDPKLKAEVEEGLGQVERATMREVEVTAMRVAAHEAFKLLVTTGNVLLHLSRKNKLRAFSLKRYVVKRDAGDNLLEIVIREEIAPSAIPPEINSASLLDKAGSSTSEDKDIALYTHIVRTDGNWEVYQEIQGYVVPDSQGSYTLDGLPWLPVRWTKVDGEDYGRGHVEEYLGDLKSLEGLSKSVVEGAAISARVVGLVNPNGMTDADDINNAENGDVVPGNPDDVGFLQVQKHADFQVALETMRDISTRLGFAFLLNTSVQRKGERVTAEEVRYMAGELEDALGGIYSILALELQLPLVTLVMDNMRRQKRLPNLPSKAVKPAITTGLEALGRGHDLSKLEYFLKGVAETFGPKVVEDYIDVSNYMRRRGTALGIDMDGLVRTAEAVAEKRQQDQMAEMAKQLGPNMINQMGNMAQQGTEQPTT